MSDSSVPIFTPEGELFLHGLFPDVYRLDSFLHQKEKAKGKNDGLQSSALLRDEFEYTVRSAWHCIAAFAHLAHQHACQILQSTLPGRHLTLGPAGSAPYHGFIDLFLSSTRRMQDGLMRYTARSLGRSLPDSMNSVHGMIADGKRGVSPALDEMISTYWDKLGAELRAYRVQAQHRGQVATDVQFRRGDHDVRIFCALPNNPAVGKASDLSYDPAVPAFAKMLEQFIGIVAFGRRLSAQVREDVRAKHPDARLGTMHLNLQFRAGLPFEPGADFGEPVLHPDFPTRHLVEALGSGS